jgi:hypothetical protein
MNLYEWSGAPARFDPFVETRRPRRWHASYGVLAVMTSLLILGGCNRQNPAETAGEPVDQSQGIGAAPAHDATPLYDETARPPDGAAGQADPMAPAPEAAPVPPDSEAPAPS